MTNFLHWRYILPQYASSSPDSEISGVPSTHPHPESRSKVGSKKILHTFSSIFKQVQPLKLNTYHVFTVYSLLMWSGSFFKG